MVAVEDVRRLSTSEKLELLETLWSELAVDDAQVRSPAWHKDALAQTRADHQAGRATFSKWGDVKERLQRDLLGG